MPDDKLFQTLKEALVSFSTTAFRTVVGGLLSASELDELPVPYDRITKTDFLIFMKQKGQLDKLKQHLIDKHGVEFPEPVELSSSKEERAHRYHPAETEQDFDKRIDEIISNGMLERLALHLQRLSFFEEQRAHYGPIAPAKLELEIESRKQEIAELQSRLGQYILSTEWQELRRKSLQKQLEIRMSRLEKLRQIRAEGELQPSEKVEVELEIEYFEREVNLLRKKLDL